MAAWLQHFKTSIARIFEGRHMQSQFLILLLQLCDQDQINIPFLAFILSSSKGGEWCHAQCLSESEVTLENEYKQF
jgi:hypothetical protein